MFLSGCQGDKFGANCRLTCHCESTDTCASDTGVCNSGSCLEGWSGINCQRKYFLKTICLFINVHDSH